MIDRPAGGRSECDEKLLVLGAEGARSALRQVEVAVDHVTHPHGHAQKAVHCGMAGGKAGGARVLGQVVEADGLLLVDEGTEQTMALGQAADRTDQFVGQPDMDELLERAIGGDHADRAEACTDEFDRGLDDALQNLGQLELPGNDPGRLEQAAQAILTVEYVLRILDQLAECAVEFGTGDVGKTQFVCHPASVRSWWWDLRP